MKVYQEFKRSDEASCLAVQGLTSEMLAYIGRLHMPERHSPAWMQKLRELLHCQFSEPLNIWRIAKELDVHPAYLSRQFRKKFGRTIGDYVRELRIQQAMVELSQTEASIADIGVKAGFADQSHFSRTFKVHTGRTPGEFRRTLRLVQEVKDSDLLGLQEFERFNFAQYVDRNLLLINLRLARPRFVKSEIEARKSVSNPPGLSCYTYKDR